MRKIITEDHDDTVVLGGENVDARFAVQVEYYNGKVVGVNSATLVEYGEFGSTREDAVAEFGAADVIRLEQRVWSEYEA